MGGCGSNCGRDGQRVPARPTGRRGDAARRDGRGWQGRELPRSAQPLLQVRDRVDRQPAGWMPVAGAEVAGSERTVLVDGTRLTCQQVRWVARDNAAVRLAAAGIERASAAADAVRQLGALVPVYGRTTGVGANREVSVSDQVGHGRRLLRSHAGGAGPPIDVPEARAMMVVRLNQLAAGGSGVKPAALETLAQALNDGLVPPVRQF